jgi:predicted O-methyltransferase YrrM
MDFLAEEINRYTEAHTQSENKVLAELNRNTWTKVLQPRMLSGHLQGRVLSMLSKMIRPKYILEIGTYTGYAALCLAEGLQEHGVVHTIDKNEELEEMVREYIDKAKLNEQVKLHIGNAIDLVPSLEKDWDLVFIDADKQNYSTYYDLLIDKMKSGSYLIADNVLWSGKVTQKYEELDEETQAIMDFNRKVHEDDRVENVLIPIRDGLMVIRVK